MEKLLRGSWAVPFGELSFRLDPLNLVFLAAIAIQFILNGVLAARLFR